MLGKFLSEIVGMDIIGLPFHEFMYVDEDVITMRVGKHGEYYYHIMGDEEVNVYLATFMHFI